MTISEISQRCGSKTVYHFSRVFSQHHGKPPRAFRQAAWLWDKQADIIRP